MLPDTFVAWKEQIVESERGNKKSNFLLVTGVGEEVLACTGFEKTPRHHVYTVLEGFQSPNKREEDHVQAPRKFKTRRELVAWLDTFVQPPSKQGSKNASRVKDDVSTSFSGQHSFKSMNHPFLHIRKKNRTRPAHVREVRDNGHLRVRWLLDTKDIARTGPAPSDMQEQELFFSTSEDIVNVEHVVKPINVLSLRHFTECLEWLTVAELQQTYCCRRMLCTDGTGLLKNCNVERLRGYFNQKALSIARSHEPARMSDGKEEPGTEGESKDDAIQPQALSVVRNREPAGAWKRWYPSVGVVAEVLCEDYGLRGCWFTVEVLVSEPEMIKVRHLHVLRLDMSGYLEEWIELREPVLEDKWCLRLPGRCNVRPTQGARVPLPDPASPGQAVEIQWHDGWWEAVVLKDLGDALAVYLTGEEEALVVKRQVVRPAFDWLRNKWIRLSSKAEQATILAEQYSIPRSGRDCNAEQLCRKAASPPPFSAEVSRSGAAASPESCFPELCSDSRVKTSTQEDDVKGSSESRKSYFGEQAASDEGQQAEGTDRAGNSPPQVASDEGGGSCPMELDSEEELSFVKTPIGSDFKRNVSSCNTTRSCPTWSRGQSTVSRVLYDSKCMPWPVQPDKRVTQSRWHPPLCAVALHLPQRPPLHTVPQSPNHLPLAMGAGAHLVAEAPSMCAAGLDGRAVLGYVPVGLEKQSNVMPGKENLHQP